MFVKFRCYGPRMASEIEFFACGQGLKTSVLKINRGLWIVAVQTQDLPESLASEAVARVHAFASGYRRGAGSTELMLEDSGSAVL